MTAEELLAVDSSSALESVRTERLLSKVLARSALARYAGVPPSVRALLCHTPFLTWHLQALRFRRGVHGKPWLEAPAATPRLSFSVSHTASLVLCAVSCAEVGLDCEPASRGSNAEVGHEGARELRLARRYFCASEVEALAQLAPGPERRALFLQLWTLKEAYVKARGDGIAMLPLSSFSFDLRGGNISAAPQSITSDWHVSLLSLALSSSDEHYVGLCCARGLESTAPRVRCWQIQPLMWEREVPDDALRLLASA